MPVSRTMLRTMLRAHSYRLNALLLVALLLGACSGPSQPDQASAGDATPATTTSAPVTAPAPAGTSTSTSPSATRAPLVPATGAPTAAPAASPAISTVDPACRSDPHANVYAAVRLVVISPCMVVTGTIMRIEQDDSQDTDGDLSFELQVDPPFANLPNDTNRRLIDGYLHIEIVAADQPGCTPGQPPDIHSDRQQYFDFGICSGANLTVPPVGTHVRVIGPFVWDFPRGHCEIHPAWAVTPTDAVAELPPAQQGLGAETDKAGCHT